MRKPIYKELYEIMLNHGLSPKNKGFMYIHEAVVGMELDEPMKNIFQRVAKEMGVKPSSVERAIRYIVPIGETLPGLIKKLRVEIALKKMDGESIGGEDFKPLEAKINTDTSNNTVTPQTRAAIKQLEREAKRDSATVQLSYGQLKAYKAELKKEVTETVSDQVFLLLLGMPILAMKDLFEVNTDIMDKFTDKILIHYKAYCEGAVKMEEIWATIEEETGKKITKHTT